MDFESAVSACKKGLRICRESWTDKGIYIGCYCDGNDEYDNRDDPYLYKFNPKDKRTCVWIPHQSDYFANDWKILK